MPVLSRELLILMVLQGFSIRRAASVFNMSEQEAEARFGSPRCLRGADEARRRRPALKVQFTMGYARNAIIHQGKLDP